MTNNILDVLTYMFDYLFDESEQDSVQEIDNIELKAHLSEAGFDRKRIDKALNWLENIATIQDKKNQITLTPTHGNALRIYTATEQRKLSAKSRGFLLFLETIGELSAEQREMIIDQVMTLGDVRLSLGDLKWIVMMVLGNSAPTDISTQWLESIVFLDDTRTQH